MFEIAGGIILAVFFFVGLFFILGIIGAIGDEMRLNAEARRAREARARERWEWERRKAAEDAALREALDREVPEWEKEAELDFVSNAKFYFEEFVKTEEKWEKNWLHRFPEHEVSIGTPFFPRDDEEGEDWELNRESLDRAKDDLLTAGMDPKRTVSLLYFVFYGLSVGGDELYDYEAESVIVMDHQEFASRAKAADFYLRIRPHLEAVSGDFS